VPERLVQEVLLWLSTRGYADSEEVVTAQEDLLFSLPKELRRDLKARAASAS
jgi:4-hydroxy-3-methylbut-2-enyl diphosphate reductase